MKFSFSTPFGELDAATQWSAHRGGNPRLHGECCCGVFVDVPHGYRCLRRLSGEEKFWIMENHDIHVGGMLGEHPTCRANRRKAAPSGCTRNVDTSHTGDASHASSREWRHIGDVMSCSDKAFYLPSANSGVQWVVDDRDDQDLEGSVRPRDGQRDHPGRHPLCRRAGWPWRSH